MKIIEKKEKKNIYIYIKINKKKIFKKIEKRKNIKKIFKKKKYI